MHVLEAALIANLRTRKGATIDPSPARMGLLRRLLPALVVLVAVIALLEIASAHAPVQLAGM